MITANSTGMQGADTTAADVSTYAVETLGIGITKTIVIAVCSSVAYLALVIGLITFCGIRLMKKRKKLKIAKKGRPSVHVLKLYLELCLHVKHNSSFLFAPCDLFMPTFSKRENVHIDC